MHSPRTVRYVPSRSIVTELVEVKRELVTLVSALSSKHSLFTGEACRAFSTADALSPKQEAVLLHCSRLTVFTANMTFAPFVSWTFGTIAAALSPAQQSTMKMLL